MRTKIVSAALLVILLAVSKIALGATLTVTTTADSGPGSLRQAIIDASVGDTITFNLAALPATISLTSGDLGIGTSLTITGPGASSLTIDATNNVSKDRVFSIKSGVTVSISGLTITHGQGGGTSVGSTSNNGGGIYNAGDLSLSDCVVSNNSAPGSGIGGGGIFSADGGTLSLTRCTVSGNRAGGSTTTGVTGGGIRSASNTTLTISDSTISSNTTATGGGIWTNGTLTVTGSTFSNNSAGVGFHSTSELDGGAIYVNSVGGSGTILNSTFSGNGAQNTGGAIANGGALKISFSTFSANFTQTSTGGAIGSVSASQTFTLTGDILSNSPNCDLSAGGTLASNGYNLSTDSSCVLTGTGDKTSTAAGLDPSGLLNNGGSTQTIALLSTSAAVDAIPAASCTDVNGNTVTTDQRGVTRPQGTGCDIGAFELQQSSATTVTNTNDSGTGSLRQAIANANAGDTINFNLTYPATITLSSAAAGSTALQIDKNLTIRGPGASNLAISGNATLQIFSVSSGVTASISGLTLENGNNANGGAFFNDGTLNLSYCVITGNQATQGAALNNQSGGVLTLTNSTVSGNTASGIGGGIFNLGTATVTASTFSSNTAAEAAGIYNGGTLTVTNTTFSGNQESTAGGALENTSTLHLSNSTFFNNSSPSISGGIYNIQGTTTIKGTLFAKASTGINCALNSGTITSQGYNLLDDTSCNSEFSNSTDHNNIPAGLDSGGLQDNGGPTETVAILSNSAALDAIPTASCTDVDGNTLTTDQRGTTRPQGSACDIGAFELVLAGPTVTTFSPASGVTGTSVTITGTEFTAASTVAFNNTNATSVTVDSDTQITATVPSGASTGAIAVTTAAGTATSSSNFTVTLSVTGFTPSSGVVGTSVTISGSGFATATAVSFNDRSASFTINSDTQITATVPSGATTGPIAVTTSAGTAASSNNFTMIPPPAITSFTPTSGGVGATVTINGTAFPGASVVTFNGTSAIFTFNSDTQITATVPSGATTGPIVVKTPGGTATSGTDFTVIPEPTITGFNPSSGAVGSSVVISGTNFTGATGVTFNSVSATFTFNSDTQVTATVPAGATTGPIAVTTAGGTAASGTTFTVVANAPPTITGFSPTSGGIGTAVTISGANLKGATSVTFNGTSATFKFSGGKIIATVPVGATTGAITVTTPGGLAISGTNFTVIPPPTITSFTPPSGPVGTQVTISGTNFTGTTSVMFGGKIAIFTVNDAQTIVATVPKGAKTGPISVTTPGGKATSASSFTVN
jgi:hypothetical protein